MTDGDSNLRTCERCGNGLDWVGHCEVCSNSRVLAILFYAIFILPVVGIYVFYSHVSSIVLQSIQIGLYLAAVVGEIIAVAVLIYLVFIAKSYPVNERPIFERLLMVWFLHPVGYMCASLISKDSMTVDLVRFSVFVALELIGFQILTSRVKPLLYGQKRK